MPLQEAAAMAVAAPGARAEAIVADLVERRLFKLCRHLLRAVPTQDQLQDARIAATLALRDYDPARGTYTALLALHVRKALFRGQNDLIRVPEYMRILLNKLDTLQADYLFRRDRAATDAEIARDLHLSPDQAEALHHTVSICTGAAADEPAPDPYEAIDTKLDVRAALQALEAIAPITARIARLHLLEGKTQRTIKALLRIGSRTVQHHIDQARLYLRQNLQAYA